VDKAVGNNTSPILTSTGFVLIFGIVGFNGKITFRIPGNITNAIIFYNTPGWLEKT